MSTRDGSSDRGSTRHRRQESRSKHEPDFDVDTEICRQLGGIDPASPTLTEDLSQLFRNARARKQEIDLKKQEADRLRTKIAALAELVDEVEPGDDELTPLLCSSCGATKPANRFSADARWRHGRAGMCRTCVEQIAQKQIKELKLALAAAES